MNLGFYVHSTRDSPLNTEIYNLLNVAMEGGQVEDASLFYNEVDFNPNSKKFGTFNSTDLWSFSGVLVTASLDNLLTATRIINKIRLAYLYSNEKNLMMLLGTTANVPVITRNEEDEKEYYRLTGQKSVLMKELDVNEIIKVCNE